MAIPTTQREQIYVSSTGNELKPVGIVVKGTYWVVFSSYGNLHMREYEGSYSTHLTTSVPYFHVTGALDDDLNLLTDRFWLWTVDTSNVLRLHEVEPMVGSEPVIHDSIQVATDVSNIRANVSDGNPVAVFTLTTGNECVIRLYSDIKSAVPVSTSPLNWSGTRLPNFDTEAFGAALNVAYLDVQSPPNVYTEDYLLTIPQITTCSQVGQTLQVNLVWDTIIGTESYRLVRSTDPLFGTYTVVYNGPLSSYADTVPAHGNIYYYEVKQELPSLGIESSWSTTQSVPISPLAAFAADTTYGNAPLTVSFVDQSTGAPSAWMWDFGDGGVTGVVQNPSHIYAAPGIYTVALTVSNTAGYDTETKIDYIEASSIIRHLDLSASAVVGAAPFSVKFQYTVLSGEWYRFLWEFGDGQTSTERFPTHVYTTPGYHTVELTAWSAGGVETKAVRRGWIRVGQLSFDVAYDRFDPVPVTAQFTNTSVSPTGYEFRSWSWDFGDGSSLLGITGPSHVYARYGRYDVQLGARLEEV